jgi:sporulation protein YabP
MLEDKKSITKPKVQNLILENRERMSISGVIDVVSFNDETVTVETELGLLTIHGDDLHISKLNLDISELNVEGDIYSLEYSDSNGSRSKSMGFFSRMFK